MRPERIGLCQRNVLNAAARCRRAHWPGFAPPACSSRGPPPTPPPAAKPGRSCRRQWTRWPGSSRSLKSWLSWARAAWGLCTRRASRPWTALVALKILPAQAAPDPGFAERFTREARALARLSHPNIVAVHEFGQVTSSAGVPPASLRASRPRRRAGKTGETPAATRRRDACATRTSSWSSWMA